MRALPFLVPTVGLLLAATLALPASAQVTTVGCANTDVSCTLDELFLGASIQVDDKLFDRWGLEVDPGTVDYSNVDVVGVPGTSRGLRFLGNGELAVKGSGCLDLRFNYLLTVEDPDEAVLGNKLSILSESVAGAGRIRVEEAVFSLPPSILGVKQTDVDALFETNQRSDQINFPGERRLLIEKEILIEGSTAADFADLEQFRQSYIQVPEPGQWAQLGTGLAFLALAASLRGAPRRVSTGRRSRCA